MIDTLPLPASLGAGVTFRHYQGLDDIPGMAAANARLRARAGIAEPIDLDAMRHRYTHLVNSDPLVDCILAVMDGATVGYARVEWHDLNDGDRLYDTTVVVDPPAWGMGIAAALTAWAEDRLVEVARSNPTIRRAWVGAWTFDGDSELVDVLAARGYEAVRRGAEMLRPDLEHLEPATLPDGYHIRIPQADELPAVFEMQVAAFAEHWGEYEAQDHELAEWIEDPRFRRDLVVVVWARDQPAACVANVLEDRPDGTVRGLLESVSTHPAHRRRGLARAAIAHSLELLRAAGATSAYLGVDVENHNRALALYESCGFRRISGSMSYRKPAPQEETLP
jgi:mycothiol synthase